MIKLSFHVLFCSIFCANLLFSRPAVSQEVDDESGFNYEEGGKKGPANWGDLKQEWHECKTGRMQSPIDLLHKRVHIIPKFMDFKIHYKPTNATLKNRGHDIMLKWSDEAGYIEINGTQYFLKQFHWHSPSEHTINGKKFALEAHSVHQSQNGNIVVIGILYRIGQPDYFLSTIKKHLEEISETNKSKVVNEIDPSLLEIQNSLYYRYNGSLTIPPCTQNVIWFIVKKVRSVAPYQVELLRVAIHDDSNTNARPLQPLNNRIIHLQFRSECMEKEH
ncbi:alpha carbonic anhydrase 7-like [Benincasa hispida]|uniref:alpha carbonic anhydrase 7-like n=1 Tax=Benincasa hispida TaxID=102211 RepID=UPI001900496A|nr:alpha carbonic anhydrase 7-like [Benincasa hispida]